MTEESPKRPPGAERIFEDVQMLAADLEDAWGDAEDQIREQLEERPYLTLGVAALAGYALGGGLATRLTTVALGVGARLAFSAIVRQASASMGASPGEAPEEVGGNRAMRLLTGIALLAPCLAVLGPGCSAEEVEYEAAASKVEVQAEAVKEKVATVEDLEAQRAELEDRIREERAELSSEEAKLRTAEAEAQDAATDDMLFERVEEAFADHPLVEMASIGIRVERGVVHLSGTVDTDAQREKAAEIAGETSGVRGVRNELVSRE